MAMLFNGWWYITNGRNRVVIDRAEKLQNVEFIDTLICGLGNGKLQGHYRKTVVYSPSLCHIGETSNSPGL